jgi:hypothetical protein
VIESLNRSTTKTIKRINTIHAYVLALVSAKMRPFSSANCLASRVVTSLCVHESEKEKEAWQKKMMGSK